jgi:hypothetical protein
MVAGIRARELNLETSEYKTTSATQKTVEFGDNINRVSASIVSVGDL